MSLFDSLINKSTTTNKYDGWTATESSNHTTSPSLESLTLTDIVCCDGISGGGFVIGGSSVCDKELKISDGDTDTIDPYNTNPLFYAVHTGTEDLTDDRFVQMIKEFETTTIITTIQLPPISPSTIKTIIKMTRLFSLFDWKKSSIIKFIDYSIACATPTTLKTTQKTMPELLDEMLRFPLLAPLICQKLHIINQSDPGLKALLNCLRTTTLANPSMDLGILELQKIISRMEIITS